MQLMLLAYATLHEGGWFWLGSFIFASVQIPEQLREL